MTFEFVLDLLAVIVICAIFAFPLWVVCSLGMRKILNDVSPYKPEAPRGTGKHFRRKGR